MVFFENKKTIGQVNEVNILNKQAFEVEPGVLFPNYIINKTFIKTILPEAGKDEAKSLDEPAEKKLKNKKKYLKLGFLVSIIIFVSIVSMNEKYNWILDNIVINTLKKPFYALFNTFFSLS